MSRASLATRPRPHACCPAARVRLETFSFAGSWSWRITIRQGTLAGRQRVVERIHISHCPWCGLILPSQRYMTGAEFLAAVQIDEDTAAEFIREHEEERHG